MKKLRIVCGALAGLHYSASPDVAMDSCPICGEACREIEIEEPVRKSLWDILDAADAITIDDNFVRYFHLEYEDIEEPTDTLLEVAFDDFEYSFSRSDIEAAVYDPRKDSWEVTTDHYTVTIECYSLSKLKA